MSELRFITEDQKTVKIFLPIGEVGLGAFFSDDRVCCKLMNKRGIDKSNRNVGHVLVDVIRTDNFDLMTRLSVVNDKLQTFHLFSHPLSQILSRLGHS